MSIVFVCMTNFIDVPTAMYENIFLVESYKQQ